MKQLAAGSRQPAVKMATRRARVTAGCLLPAAGFIL